MGRDIKTKFNAFVLIGILMLASGIASIWLADIYQSDTQNTYSTKILCSNGNVYNATAANLQTAIYSLNTTGGKITLPVCNLTITISILLKPNIVIEGQGNKTVLYLQSSANQSIFKNYTNIVLYDVHIKNLVIDGNGMNQPIWTHFGSDYPTKLTCGMKFKYLYHSSIENVVFRRTKDAAIFLYHYGGGQGGNIIIKDCYFYQIGKVWEGAGAGYEIFFPSGIYLQNCNKTIITGCYFDDVHGNCIVRESGTVGMYSEKSIISDCIMNNAYCGIWLEYMKNCVVSNCIASNMNKLEAYFVKVPTGFISSNSVNITYSLCDAIYCGNTAGLNGSGFESGSCNGVTFIGCSSLKTYGYGFNTSSTNTTISNCYSRNDSKTGMYLCLVPGNIKVTSNTITKPGRDGIYINSAYAESAIISDNIIDLANRYGIYNNVPTGIISSNSIYKARTTGIYSDGGRGGIISNNNINTTIATGSDGIVLTLTTDGRYYPSNMTITGNMIYDPIDDGIVLAAYQYIKNCTISNNIVKLADVGILEQDDANFNNIFYNNVKGCTTPVTVFGAKTLAIGNLGTYSVVPMFNMSVYGIRAGFMWYDASVNKLYIYDGAAWDEQAFT